MSIFDGAQQQHTGAILVGSWLVVKMGILVSRCCKMHRTHRLIRANCVHVHGSVMVLHLGMLSINLAVPAVL